MVALDLPSEFLEYKKLSPTPLVVNNGTFGSYQGTDGKRVIVGLYKYQDNSNLNINEIIVLNSPYTVKRLAYNINNGILGIVMTEEIVEMTLEKYIQTTTSIPEDVILLFCYSMLQLMNSKKLNYGCINPRNILICEGFTFKLTGLPFLLRNSSSSHSKLENDKYTLQYLPPDVKGGLKISHDLYSVAAVMYEMYTHTIPNFSSFPSDNSKLKSNKLKETIASLINFRKPFFLFSDFLKNCPSLSNFQNSKLYVDHTNYLNLYNDYQNSIQDQINGKESLAKQFEEKRAQLKEKGDYLDSLKRQLMNLESGRGCSAKIDNFEPFKSKNEIPNDIQSDFDSLIPSRDKNSITKQFCDKSTTFSGVELLQLRLPGNRMIRIEDGLCLKIGKLLPLIPGLKQLILRRCNMKATGLRYILCGIEKLANFESLDLSGNTNYNDTTLKEIFRVFKGKPNKFKVVIKDIQITSNFLTEATTYPNITFER